jgi:hypothetical protein
MREVIAGITIPDSAIALDATHLIRSTTSELIFNHSRRVFLFGSLQSRVLGINPDPELLYVAALFHDTGLVPPYRSDHQRFELDGADQARAFLTGHGVPHAVADTVWTAIALHTTPEVPYRMAPVIAATTAGVETDVLGLHLDNVSTDEIKQVITAHPRPGSRSRSCAPSPRVRAPPGHHLRHRQRRRARALRAGLPTCRLRRRHSGLSLARVAQSHHDGGPPPSGAGAYLSNETRRKESR